MKTEKLTRSTMHQWLIIVFNILILACAPVRIYGEDRGLAGGYVVDPAITVPANAYTTFSTVLNGKRYYLGVDTTAAKSGKDTIAVYDKPCYAAMWIAGPMWSPTGNILPNKDYTRTVKSVWIKERCNRDKYLSVGADNKNYSPLILTGAGNATMWHTAKDFTVQSQQMHGFVYYYSDENGIETYRYFSYDPVYGFSRLYATRPTVSQRISVWDRHQGPDITCTLTPSTHTFGLNLTEDTVKLPITSRVYYYEYVDRFRSRYNQMDVFASATDPIYDQETLIKAPYNLYGFYEWKSNPRPRSVAHPTEPRNPKNAETDGGAYTYDGKSKMSLYGVTSMSCEDPEHPTEETCHPVYGKIDSTMLWVSDLKYDLDEEADLWYDTIFAIGQSMYDVHEAVETSPGVYTEGELKEHSDWLRQHFYINGNHFVDSIQVNRRTFLNARHTSITLRTTPADAVFNYSYDNKDADGKAIVEADTAVTFTVIGDYESVTDILYINNAIATTIVDEGEGEDDLDIAHMPAFQVNEVWYDTLIVEALMPDGKSAIVGAEGASDKAWIESVRLIGRDKIRVKIAQFDETESNRTAQIRFTYRYYHSDIAGDVATATRSIWITKKKKSASSAELYSFSHKSGKGNLDGSGNETTGISTPQPVHTKKYTLYAIPSEGLQLPLHRDYWGYYRWYKWAGNTIANEHDIENTTTWSWTKRPQNQLKGDFMPINPATDNSSRGQWDIFHYDQLPSGTNHFTVGTQTSVPAVRYPSGVAASTTLKDTFACDVSAYMDIDTTGTVNDNLSALTEPTLSYRNIFYVRPAIEQADKMSHCLFKDTIDSEKKWMEEREVLVPAGRAFSLHPQYPVLNGEHDVVEESHLQYIYYFNPAATGSMDPYMGLKAADRDDKTAACYGRIGKTSYTGTLSTTILDATTLSGMSVGQTKTILLVNPGKRSGYVMGSVAQSDKVSFGSFDGVVTNAADLKNMLDSYYVNAAAFVMVLTKTADATEGNLGKFTIYCKRTAGNKPRYLTAYWAWNYWYTVRFPEPISTNTYTRDITISAPFTIDGGTSTERINTADTYVADASNLFRLYMYEDGLHSGNIGAHSNYYSSTDTYSDSDEEVELYSTSSLPGKTVNGAWCMYEITDRTEHTETPVWEYSATEDGTWTKVAEEGTNTSQYEMLSDGSLKVKSTVHTTPNAYAGYYRLRTEHFQLAKFAVWNTNPTTDGPSNTALVKEEDIHNHYDILFTFGTENFAAPNTENDTAYNHHMPWSFSELSYHYPEAVIGASDRVDGASLLPMKGEYAYINKFVDPTNPSHEIESMSGARYGYMLCIHTPEKPANFFQFEYPEIPCADQELFLTANICNPIADNGYNPEITADLEGTKDGGATWELIYRYKTGEIPYNAERPWYQIVLPIKQDAISGYQKFRCTASTHSTMADNAYMLIDRVRFIAKARPLSVFQNKTTCLAADRIDIVARLDYKNSTFGEGKLVAYQYQKKVGNSYVALPTTGVGSVTYIKDTLPETDLGYGVLRIPAKNFNPAEGPSSAYIRPIGGVTSTTRSYVNEASSGAPYWTMYISQKVSATANDTFRVAMSIMTKETAPDFAGSRCATERILGVKKPVVLYVDGSEWTAERSEADVAANNTYRVQAVLTDAVLPDAARRGTGTCKFDILRSTETVDYNTLIAAWQAAMASGVEENITTTKAAVDAADAAFTAEYGVNHSDLLDYLEIFRNLASPHAETTNWNEVHPLDFTYSGRSEDESRKIYNALNKLIAQDHKLQIGVDYHDVFLGSNQNIYYHLHPIPASGRYIVAATGKEAEIEVCNSPIWFEMHSALSNYELRLGLDHIVNGNYEVPVIRASKTDANTSLKVRVAEITSTESKLSVIGWDKTELVETNDPTWNATAVGSRIFKYNTNKNVYSKTPSSYYSTSTADSIITFTPAVENNYDGGLRAGYWYTFDVPFYGVNPTATYPAEDAPETLAGHARFILAVAPDTVRWTPSHNESANYWNDDNNWTPVMASVPADGFKARVPMGDTKVIIPQVGEGMLPIVSDVVVEQKDTLDYGYAKNTCDKILFKPNAQMLGQEKLNYEKAFVDVHFKTGEWQTFSPALEDIYAGDMYIPFSGSYNPNIPSTGASIDTVDFETKPFPYAGNYAGNYNPREYPFAFYQGFYNASVPVPFYNTDTNDSTLSYKDSIQSKSTVDWVNTPSLGMHYAPGAPCIIMGYDATDEDGNDIVVRLPKPETQYYGYGQVAEDRYISGMVENLPSRSTHQNLAYDKYASATIGTNGLSYTLRNATPADLFFFGNPTMALVDVYKLCVDNDSVLKHEEGKYYFTAYQLMDGSNYTAKTITGPGQYFIAPQRAIGLIAKKERSSLPITLKPSALVAITGDGLIVNSPEIVTPSSAPKRIARTKSVYEEPEKRWLYVTASNETDDGLKKAYLTLGEQSGANRGYTFGEDALNIASGLNYDANDLFVTPLTMYTIADNQALMQDVRDTLVSVPLIFTTLEDYTYSDYTILSFSMNGAWDKPLYLYDALTNDSILIRNGLQIAIQTPNSDQIRYFINGAPKAKGEGTNGEGVTTDIESVSPQDGLYSDSESGLTSIYDMLGRKVMTLSEYDLLSTIQLPTGVYIIQRGNQTERMVIR